MSRFKIGNIKGPKGDKGETGAVGPKGEQGIQGPVGPAGGVNSVNGMTGDVTVEDTQGVNLLRDTASMKTYKRVGCSLKTLEDGSVLVDFPKHEILQWADIRTESYPIPLSLVREKQVTFSLDVRSDDWEELNKDNSHGLVITFDLCTANSVERTKFHANYFYTLPIFDEWKQVKLTAILNDSYFESGTGIINDTDRVVMQINNYSVYGMQARGFKLEFGRVENPIWTPAPEDIVTHTEMEQAVTGENLLNGTNLLGVLTKDGYGRWRHADKETSIETPIAITDAPNPTIKTGWKIVNQSSDTGGIAQAVSPVVSGKTYTLSCYARGKVGKLDLIYGAPGSYPRKTFTIDASNSWAKYSYPFVMTEREEENGITTVYFETANCPDGIEICGMKLEPGNTADFIYTESPTDQLFHALDPIPEAHRNNYRGRNLGESTQMSEAHKKAIQDGSFKDLFVGDYWTHDGINYRIADVDYFYNCGDNSAFTKHHVVIVPDTQLCAAQMNTDDVTTGGYTGSEMYTKNLAQAKTTIKGAFKDMVLSHRDYFVNAVASGGYPSGGGWFDSEIDLMNEIMVYGTHVFAPDANGTTIPNKYTTGNSQLALFRLNPKFIKTRQNYWLRDVASDASFAIASNYGTANDGNASNPYGVRPYFCIGVQASADEAEDDMEVVPSVGNPERMEADEMDDSDLDMSTMGDPLDTTY